MPDRFPPPWTVIDDGRVFIVQDANRYPMAYVYYRHDDDRVERPSRDQAWRIARNIARLPRLLGRY